MNVVRAGLNRSVSLADNRRTVDVPPGLSWIPGDPFGYLTIRGMVTEMAGDFRLPRDDRLHNWQIADTLVLTRGGQVVKIGVQAQYLQFDQHTTSQVGGIVNFANLQSFLQGRAISVDFAVPGKIDPDRRYRQALIGAFVQDDVRLSPRLSANLGLRYEFVTVPTEADGKISNLRHVSDPALTVGGAWHSNPSLRNVAPRVGVAWDPFGTGRTSVRSGFGIFHDEVLPKYYFFSGSLNPPFTTRTSIQSPPFPNVVANFDPNAPIRAQLQTVNYDLRTPYIMQFNVSVQRAIAGDVDVMVGYVGSRGRNLFRLGDANLAPEEIVNGVKVYHPELGRRNPNFQGIWQRVTDATSRYNSLQVGVNKRMSNGWRAQVAYTLSKSVDDSSGINSQDFSNVVQYGLDDVQRHVGDAVFPEPIRARRRGLERMVAQQHYDRPLRPSVHGAARVQSLGQPEHDELLDARAARRGAGLRSGARRPEPLLGHRVLRPSAGEPARNGAAQFGGRPGPGGGGHRARQGVRVRRTAPRAEGGVLQPAQPRELRGAVGADGVHRRGGGRIADRRADVGPHHLDGDDVAADSAGGEGGLLASVIPTRLSPHPLTAGVATRCPARATNARARMHGYGVRGARSASAPYAILAAWTRRSCAAG
ncbi:MAG: hypothetical protein DMF86_25875 [Acidobacteria bacterium]|nr:MAG: hypothetical protein DMF86_25875 [Acidobacteriota bacterium]